VAVKYRYKIVENYHLLPSDVTKKYLDFRKDINFSLNPINVMLDILKLIRKDLNIDELEDATKEHLGITYTKSIPKKKENILKQLI